MTRMRRLLCAAGVAAVFAVTAAPANADLCFLRIKWNEKSNQWEWADEHDWECQFCVPAIIGDDPFGNGPLPRQVDPRLLPGTVDARVLDELGDPTGGGGSTDPLETLEYAEETVHSTLQPVFDDIDGVIASLTEAGALPFPPGPGCPTGWVGPDDDGAS